MEIRIEIPKIVYEDSNLTRLKRTISTGYYLRSGTGTGAIRNYYFQGLSPTLHDNDIVRVYNIEKINAVRKRDFSGRYRKISPTKYIAHIYDIPIDIIKKGNLSVIQKKRHFEIKSL